MKLHLLSSSGIPDFSLRENGNTGTTTAYRNPSCNSCQRADDEGYVDWLTVKAAKQMAIKMNALEERKFSRKGRLRKTASIIAQIQTEDRKGRFSLKISGGECSR